MDSFMVTSVFFLENRKVVIFSVNHTDFRKVYEVSLGQHILFIEKFFQKIQLLSENFKNEVKIWWMPSKSQI
jgi:hypothetical protein